MAFSGFRVVWLARGLMSLATVISLACAGCGAEAARPPAPSVAVPLATTAPVAPVEPPAPKAPPITIEVLIFSSKDAVEEAHALTDAFRHAVIESGQHLSPEAHDLEAEAIAVDCDDPVADACAPKLAADVKVDHIVYGRLVRTKMQLTATIRYWNGVTLRTATQTYDGAPFAKDGTAPELKSIALQAMHDLGVL